MNFIRASSYLGLSNGRASTTHNDYIGFSVQSKLAHIEHRTTAGVLYLDDHGRLRHLIAPVVIGGDGGTPQLAGSANDQLLMCTELQGPFQKKFALVKPEGDCTAAELERKVSLNIATCDCDAITAPMRAMRNPVVIMVSTIFPLDFASSSEFYDDKPLDDATIDSVKSKFGEQAASWALNMMSLLHEAAGAEESFGQNCQALVIRLRATPAALPVGAEADDNPPSVFATNFQRFDTQDCCVTASPLLVPRMISASQPTHGKVKDIFGPYGPLPAPQAPPAGGLTQPGPPGQPQQANPVLAMQEVSLVTSSDREITETLVTGQVVLDNLAISVSFDHETLKMGTEAFYLRDSPALQELREAKSERVQLRAMGQLFIKAYETRPANDLSRLSTACIGHVPDPMMIKGILHGIYATHIQNIYNVSELTLLHYSKHTKETMDQMRIALQKFLNGTVTDGDLAAIPDISSHDKLNEILSIAGRPSPSLSLKQTFATSVLSLPCIACRCLCYGSVSRPSCK